MTQSVRVRITGRVQGVGFRNWTQRKALALGLSGWVRNLSDGAVEALFAGEDDVIAGMIEVCRQGPSQARVTDIRILALGEPAEAGFLVLKDG